MIRVDPSIGIDTAIKLFRKATEHAGTFKALRRHEFFVGSGERRRLKSRMARKRRW